MANSESPTAPARATMVHLGSRRIGKGFVFREDVREALKAGQNVFLATPEGGLERVVGVVENELPAQEAITDDR